MSNHLTRTATDRAGEARITAWIDEEERTLRSYIAWKGEAPRRYQEVPRTGLRDALRAALQPFEDAAPKGGGSTNAS